jgi:16S rRNA (uracil1498-N3)-methyltransferase
MRRRFFIDHFDNQRASLEGDHAHHLGRVLRAQPGQIYELSDGTSVWLGRIDVVTRDKVDFALIEKLAGAIPQLDITLLLSIVKFDAFEWALEKATELGVTRIIPLAAARSEKALLAAANKRAERWKKILLESSQQCRRVQLPILDPVAKPESVFAQPTGGIRVLLSESPEARPLREILSGIHAIGAILAIGPEGGWTDAEFAAARASHFHEASLGKLILRTETAVIAALASLNFALTKD